MQEDEAAVAREYKAVPAPRLAESHSVIIKPVGRSVTEPQEFSLRSLSRHEAASASFQKQIEEENKKSEERKKFKARRAPRMNTSSSSLS